MPNESSIQSVHSTTVSNTQRVFHDLRERIIRGEIAPGEKLKVASLKSLLQVGATPIREALSLLTSDQLVERIDQRGFRAARASKKHFLEILDLRCQLETMALRNSICAGDEPWQDSLLSAHKRLTAHYRNQNRSATGTDSHSWETLHKNFHMALIQACGSPMLLKYCDQLFDLNVRYRFLAGKSGQYTKRDIGQEHSEILDAAINRDEQLACTALLYHYRKTGEFLSDSLNC